MEKETKINYDSILCFLIIVPGIFFLFSLDLLNVTLFEFEYVGLSILWIACGVIALASAVIFGIRLNKKAKANKVTYTKPEDIVEMEEDPFAKFDKNEQL